MSGDSSLVHQNVSHELTEERWRRIEALFHAARELPEDERPPFLEREAAGDPELRRQVGEMLAQAGAAAGLLAGTVSSVARKAAGRVDWVGRRVGPYRLVREIGRGGMGVVFEACRADDEYRKTVALKIAPEWRDWDTLGDRLRHERQILAELEHPNIARFLEGGSQDGVPYFAMEFVEGKPITTFCVERRLSVRKRIELFRHVCAAVHYAHERLVVHRDLKPANILVTREGVPKLLDFGIAKLLIPIAEDRGATGGMRLWTPDYTSPEQVRGGSVTTRTDVYLLGLILYELLSAEKAQEADSSSPIALDHSICEAEPAPPSQRAAARGDTALARQLRGDLDTIVAMALRKEPERRYGSAAALSHDLGRYLDGHTVEARPGSFGYRVWKLVRRHRAAVAAAALVFISTTGGVMATVYQARRAERRFQEVRRLANSVLFGVDDRIKELAGATQAREWVASNAVQYLNNLSKDAGNDRALLFELAVAYQKVGDVQGYSTQGNLGNTPAGLESHRRAIGILETLAAGNSDPKFQRLLARGYQRVAALAHSTTNKLATIEGYRRALVIADRLYAAHPESLEDADLVGSILMGLGQYEIRAGDVAAGSRSFTRAFEVATRRAKEHPGDQAEATVVRIRRQLVRIGLYTGDLENAERIAKENIGESEALAARQPGNAGMRRDLMNNYVEMAYVYWYPGFLGLDDPKTAVRYHEKALTIARELAANDPNNATSQADLSIAEADICDALNQYDPAQAVGHCQEALAIASKWTKRLMADTARVYLADSLERIGRKQEALGILTNGIALRQKLVDEDPSFYQRQLDQLRTRNQMARLQLALGNRAGSLEEHGRALALAESLTKAKPDNLVCRRDLADTYEGFGRYYEGEDWKQARAWYQKSLDIWTAWPSWAPTTRMDQGRRERASKLVARCEGK